MSILLSDKSILALPNEMINEIISFLPRHPVAQLMFYHIHYFEEQHNVPFYKTYFVKLKSNKSMYKHGMDRALEKYLRKVEELKFMKQVGLDEGMNYRLRKQLWRCERGYDSDNDTIFSEDIIYTDSDDDSDME